MSLKFRGKRYKEAAKLVPATAVTLEAAFPLLKQMKKAKFDETVNIAIHLGIDPKQADQMVRGAVSLPKGIGKTNRVIAFVQGNNIDVAKAAGAIEAGADELATKVGGGWTDFDVAIATPDMMPKIARLGKVLGPQGKMPSPKAGTVTTDVATAVREYTAGKIEFRNDSGGNIHAVLGKMSFADADLVTNATALIDVLRKMKPAASKGTYIKKITIHSSMSPGINVDTTALGIVKEEQA
ncbi:MAG: 50S ribosomal protein L1 [Phycisphaerales bacterium]|nr:50S ribosomal protein L1 [Phycisphaerales bacterium]